MKWIYTPKWTFVFFSLFLASFLSLLIYIWYPEYLGYTFLFFYIIPSNSFIPFPHEPAIIYYGKILGPFSTTLTAIVPTIIACIIDYAVLSPVFSRTRLANLKKTGVYKKTVRYFSKLPFITIFMAAISPVPFYPIRVLSVASEYPGWKYTLAVVLGRIPRYYFLAFFGAALNIPNWLILIFFLSLVSVPIYERMSSRKKAGGKEPEEILIVKETIRPTDQKISP